MGEINIANTKDSEEFSRSSDRTQNLDCHSKSHPDLKYERRGQCVTEQRLHAGYRCMGKERR